MKKQIFIVSAVVLLGIGTMAIRAAQSPDRAVVQVSDFALNVRVADSFLERRTGLGGMTLSRLEADGMLFVFPDEQVREFWMKNMKFPIDVVWIRDNRVAQIDLNVQPPEDGEEPERMSSDPLAVNYVLELPAGSVAKYGIMPGSPVTIDLDE